MVWHGTEVRPFDALEESDNVQVMIGCAHNQRHLGYHVYNFITRRMLPWRSRFEVKCPFWQARQLSIFNLQLSIYIQFWGKKPHVLACEVWFAHPGIPPWVLASWLENNWLVFEWALKCSNVSLPLIGIVFYQLLVYLIISAWQKSAINMNGRHQKIRRYIIETWISITRDYMAIFNKRWRLWF